MHMVGIQYLLATGVSPFFLAPSASTFFFHCSPYQFTSAIYSTSWCTREQESSKHDLGPPEDPWNPCGRSARSNFPNTKELLAFHICTFEVSTGTMTCDITTQRMRNSYEIPAVFYLLYQTLMRVTSKVSSVNLPHFGKHSYFSLKMLLTVTCHRLIIVFLN